MIHSTAPASRATGSASSSLRYSRPETRGRRSPVSIRHTSTISPLSVITMSAFSSASRYGTSVSRSTIAGAAGTTTNPPRSPIRTASAGKPVKNRTPRIVLDGVTSGCCAVSGIPRDYCLVLPERIWSWIHA